MSYSVMFYAVDVPKLQAVFGSNDQALLQEVMASQWEEIEENDEFAEDQELPLTTARAMQNIFAGTVDTSDRRLGGLYGYTLKMLCQHMGEFAAGDIYNTRILPFESKLLSNGVPIPIPEPEDFPEVGYLTQQGLVEELEAARNPLPTSSPHFFDNMHQFTHHSLSEDELLEELEYYQEVLEVLIARGLGTVAFRH